MQPGKSRVRCNMLGDLWIVFHCARAERIEIAVHAEVPMRQFGKVPNDIEFAQFRKLCRSLSKQSDWHLYRRHITRPWLNGPSPRHTLLKDKFHRTLSNASANMPISCLVRFSVTQIRIEFSIPL